MIDVKAEAEAERIARAYIYSKFSYGGDVSGHRKDLHDEILQFADSVREEAIRETVEKARKAVSELFNQSVVVTRHTIDAHIRQAFAEPGKEQGFLTSSPDTLRQFVDAAVRGATQLHTLPASCPENCPACTILRLAPQLREKP